MSKQLKGQTTKKVYHDKVAMDNLEAVGLVKRFIAYMIDFYFGMLLCSLPIVLGNGIINQSEKMQMNLYFFEGSTFYIIGIISLLIGYFYYVVVPNRMWKGQTVAKHLLHIKIIKMDGNEVDGKTLFIRQIIGMFLIEGAVVSCSTLIRQMLTYGTNINFVDTFIYVGLGITLLSSLLMVFTGKRRMLHDFIGSTRVIQTT